MGYGIKIKQIRIRAGLTIEEAARRSEISPGTLTGYENEEIPIPVTSFVKLARLYGFNMFEVLEVNGGGSSYGADTLVYDVPPDEILMAYCDIAVQKEREQGEKFGNVLPRSYYEMQHKKLFNRVKNDPEIKAYFSDHEKLF